jgi:hypothetical protein
MPESQNTLVVHELGTNAVVEVAGGGGTGPNGKQPLSQALIERTLDGLEIAHRRDADGDICVVFSDTTPRIGSDLNCWLMVAHGEIFRLVCMVAPKVPATNFPRALVACNAAHMKFRFGRFLLHIEEGQSEGRLRGDAQVLLEEGVTETFLANFIMSHLACAHEFFETAWEQGLYQDPPPPPAGAVAAGRPRRMNGRGSEKRNRMAQAA